MTSAVARLTAVVAGLAVVWGGILPRLGRHAAVARHVAAMEQGGVNPAAMYYTELDRLPHRPSWIEERIVLWPWRDGHDGGRGRVLAR